MRAAIGSSESVSVSTAHSGAACRRWIQASSCSDVRMVSYWRAMSAAPAGGSGSSNRPGLATGAALGLATTAVPVSSSSHCLKPLRA